MIKKTINFTDFNGVAQSEEHYFHLSKAYLVRRELASNGTFTEELQRIAKSSNGKEIMDAFEGILKDSYGVRSEDGRAFVQNDAVWNEFRSSLAYDALFLELVTGGEAAADFIHGLMPDDVQQMRSPLRADGRPALQDHLPKQTKPAETVQKVEEPLEELQVTDEPANDQGEGDYDAFLAWKASQPKPDTGQ